MNSSFNRVRALLVGASALALAALSGQALAANATGANTTAPGVVNFSVGGNNGNVTINTQTAYVQDSVNLQTTGAFSVDQSNRFQSVGEWTGDGNDIDRVAAFSGVGTITAQSNYSSPTAWSVGASTLTAGVTATSSGDVAENLTFDQNNAGAFTQDQWTKQRSIQVDGAGNYDLGVSDVGASIAPSLASLPTGSLPAFNLSVESSSTTGGTSDLLFAPTSNTSLQGLSYNADHGQYTGLSTNMQLNFTGTPVVNVDSDSVQGAALTFTNVPGVVFGGGTVN